MIIFACIAPHPPIILPSVGSEEDRLKLRETIKSLDFLRSKISRAEPDRIIISSPHPDWGFEVPLHFLAQGLKGAIERVLIATEPPRFYFEKGAEFLISNSSKKGSPVRDMAKIALIASGDLSHCLKKDGPYGFHPDGPNFDKELIEALKRKDIKKILELDKLHPQAGQCGLRSFSFILGILESSGANYQPEILSYQSPFGVGYLTADLKR